MIFQIFSQEEALERELADLINMKKIKLTRGRYVIVDNSLFDELNKLKWYYSSSGYAMRDIKIKGQKRQAILMHRQIVNAPLNFVVDHIDGNKLNNIKSNLRIVTQHENQINRKYLNKNNNSGYRGVGWHPETGKWRARIMVNYQEKHLGLFITKEKAAFARKQATQKYFGEFAYLNQIGGSI